MKQRLFSWLLCLSLLLSCVQPLLTATALQLTEEHCNSGDTVMIDQVEYYLDLEADDQLCRREGNEITVLLEEPVITLLKRGETLLLTVYRDGNSTLLTYDGEFHELCDFDGVVSSMVLRGDELFYLLNGTVCRLSLSTMQSTDFAAEGEATLLYLSEDDALVWHTSEGVKHSHSFVDGTTSFSAPKRTIAYVPRLTAPATNDPYYTTLNVFHNNGYGMVPNNGNCTCYAYGRSYENLGKAPRLSINSAGGWYDFNRSTGYYPYGSQPALGAVAVWTSSGSGHVAVVEVIDGDTVITSESGWRSYYFRTVTRSASSRNFSASSSYSFKGFIYVLGTDVAPSNSVMLDPCGGECEVGGINTTVGSVLENLPVPTREGYDFVGWFTEPDCGGIRMEEGMIFDEETATVWYAGWEHNTHLYDAKLTPPTCLEGGFTDYVCRICGDEYRDDETPAMGHAFDVWITLQEPSCTVEGMEIASCMLCGECETKVMEKAPHSWDAGRVTLAPTMEAEGTRQYTCTVCGATKTEEIPILLPFTDVVLSDYFYVPVAWALKNHVTNGADATHFNPNAACSRAQVVTFLWRAAGSPTPSPKKLRFTDVKSTDYFYKAVLWAVENGITNGLSETRFGSESPCTRGQVVTFQYRAHQSPEVQGDCAFSDVGANDYYRTPVIWAVENGITNGSSPERFSPEKTCTRGQIVTFLYRDYNK